MSTFADLQFDGKISATEITGAVTYDLTLQGAANGLRDLTVFPVSAFEAIEGAYTGLVQQGNLKRKSGNGAYNLLLNADTKDFAGKTVGAFR